MPRQWNYRRQIFANGNYQRLIIYYSICCTGIYRRYWYGMVVKLQFTTLTPTARADFQEGSNTVIILKLQSLHTTIVYLIQILIVFTT